MTDKEDHVIISDGHHCPLELDSGEAKSAFEGNPDQSSPKELGPSMPAQIPKSPTSSTNPEFTLPPESTPASEPQNQVPRQELVEPAIEDSAEPEAPATNGEVCVEALETNTPESDRCRATGGKSSPYPDEQAVKAYLKRLSDHALEEHTTKTPSTLPSAQVSLKHNVQQALS